MNTTENPHISCEELNHFAEMYPGLLSVIAANLGVTINEVRQQAEQKSLSKAEVKKAVDAIYSLEMALIFGVGEKPTLG